MESESSKISNINANLEIKIKDFRTATKSSRKGEYVEHPDGNFTVWFSALASPNGFDEDTEGWLVVRPYVTVLRGKYRPQDSALSWIVSVIDSEGETRIPRSFMQNLSEDFTDAKYLQRSFILNRADEFLHEGVLTLRCDIFCFQSYADGATSAPESHSKIERQINPYVSKGDKEPVMNDPEPQGLIENYKEFLKESKALYNRVQRIISDLDISIGYKVLVQKDPEVDDLMQKYTDIIDTNEILPEALNKIEELMIPNMPTGFQALAKNDPEPEGSIEIKFVKQNKMLSDPLCETIERMFKHISRCDQKPVKDDPTSEDLIQDYAEYIMEHKLLTEAYNKAERSNKYISRCDQETVKNSPELEVPMQSYGQFMKKNKILTEVLYLSEVGKFSAIYDTSSEKEKHPNVWRFDTRNEGFNVILDETRNNVGALLLKASPVIRQCVNAPMKEQREKRIEFPNVDSQTFQHVMFFLKNETLPKFEFDELLEIYKFSHLYEMEALQRNCAENMMDCWNVESDFVDLQKIAGFYSDEHLSKLLHTRRHEYENFERDFPHVRLEDELYSDCYS